MFHFTRQFQPVHSSTPFILCSGLALALALAPARIGRLPSISYSGCFHMPIWCGNGNLSLTHEYIEIGRIQTVHCSSEREGRQKNNRVNVSFSLVLGATCLHAHAHAHNVHTVCVSAMRYPSSWFRYRAMDWTWTCFHIWAEPIFIVPFLCRCYLKRKPRIGLSDV